MWQVSTHQPVGNCSICCDAHCVVSQSVILTLHTDICKLSMENHFLDLDVNVNLIIEKGLKELMRRLIVYTELRWVLFC